MEGLLICQSCGCDNEKTARRCANTGCNAYQKSELECLRSIDISVKTVKRIAVWWLALSIVATVAFAALAIDRLTERRALSSLYGVTGAGVNPQVPGR